MLDKADRFPPCLCRFVARKGNGKKPMSHSDLAERTGLNRSYVAVLSLKTSWKGIPIDVVERFSRACGVNILHPKRTIEYLRNSKKAHLENANPNQRKFFARLFNCRNAIRASRANG